MRILAIFTTILFIQFSAYAQKQDNVWCMGHKGGIDFNTIPPTKFESSIYSIETVASISNRHTGALQFYTDGARIWDASHNMMLNGTGIGLDENLQSSVQGAVIVPFIDNEHKYYVFTIPASGATFGHLCYSVVDMTLNNGLGGVVPGMKKIKVGEQFSESMIAMQGCGIVWLVTQQRKTGDFYAYKISANGINTAPVVSPLGYSRRPAAQAGIKAAPGYKKIASIGRFFYGDNDGDPFIALQDFDPATGKVTNGTLVDTSPQAIHYGCEFSPNGKLLYVTSDNKVFQYNLSLNTPAAIAASKTIIGQSTSFLLNGLQRRDDGNIYIVRYESPYLDRISNCDAAAPGCVFTSEAVEMGGVATYNLPAKIVLPQQPGIGSNTKTDVSICNNIPVVLTTNQQNISWQDGSQGNSYTVTQAGVYWVRGYSADCKVFTDTFIAEDVQLHVTINSDTILCKGDTIILYSNPQPGGATYTWNDGNTNDTIAVSGNGMYQLTVSYKGCTDRDEALISYHPIVNIDLGNDTQICKGAAIILPQTISGSAADKYLWQDSSTGATFKVTEPGKYVVTLYSVCETISDSIIITGRNCHLFFPGIFTPNGDGRNDIARMIGDIGALTDFRLNIYNRWGERVYTTDNPIQGWDGNYKGKTADLGVYFYMIQYKYLGEGELMKGDIVLMR